MLAERFTELDLRLQCIDWAGIAAQLDSAGYAMLPAMLDTDDCAELASLYSRNDIFRSRVVMARHGFGRGEYKYFHYPLPDLVAHLRSHVYPRLVPVANAWHA
jgi:hypothetical protein